MTSAPPATTSLDELRALVRSVGVEYALPAELRARLVLAVTTLARPEFTAGRSVSLSARVHTDVADEPFLAVCLRAPGAPKPLAGHDLPLPASVAPGHAVEWHIPLPTQAFSGRHGDSLVEEEIGAVIQHADAMARELRQAKHELSETNSGVLAMFVQLEERDERLRRVHGEIFRELEDALRPPAPSVDGVELAVHYAPAGTDAPTGGDLYDWFVMPDGTLHITVVDALGHGVTSTRSALNVMHTVRTLSLEGHALDTVVARTDEILQPTFPELMATVLLARLDPATGELTLANGSHPPALLVRAGGEVVYQEVQGRGVGFFDPGSDRLHRTRLEPGDLLLLYTDGLTESRRDPLEGEQRLITAAREHAARPTAEIPQVIARDMHTIVLHHDDTLVMAVRFTG
jgi:serine phosphatase RsbU (regulator of sigma subunit)